MHRQRRQFPLIPDGESCLQEPVSMRLYENEDLITNIHGTYHEKDYDNVTRDDNFVGNIKNDAERIKTVSEGKSYAELARDEARRDIKKKI